MKLNYNNQTICGGTGLLCLSAIVSWALFCSYVQAATPQLPAPVSQDAFPLVDAYEPNFLRMTSSKPQAELSADYYPVVAAASQGKVFRFNSMPVPVFINHFPDETFMAAVTDGMRSWEDTSKGLVRFVPVDSPDKARIQIQWKRLGANTDVSGCLQGAQTITRFAPVDAHATAHYTLNGVPMPMQPSRAGGKYGVAPQIVELNLDLIMSKSAETRTRLVRNIATHELGHALGLLGHSEEPGDLMYAITDEHSRLSDRDLATLKRLYSLPPDVDL